MTNTPKTDNAAFDITWRNGAYYVSIPNVDHVTVVSAELAREIEHENTKLREALAPFAVIRDTVPLYVIPNLPDCNITVTLPASVWQRAKDVMANGMDQRRVCAK